MIVRAWIRIVCAMLIFSVIVAPLRADDTTTREAAEATRKQPLLWLTQVDGPADKEAYRASIAGHVADLVARARHAKRPIDQATLRCAAANTILARGLEPACTCKLLGIDDVSLGLPPAQIEAMLAQVDTLLGEAKGICEGMAEPDAADAKRTRRATKAKVDHVAAFASAIRAALLPAEDGDMAARRAASALSMLREDDDPQVASAAGFWQAYLRSTESNPAPALASLALALEDPREGTMPHALFARLLRCRLVAAKGGHAVALTLLAQLEERCEDWFEKPKQREDARCAVVLVRMQLLRRWADTMDVGTQAGQRAWCSDREQSLLSDNFGPTGHAVMRLIPAVPMLVEVPDA